MAYLVASAFRDATKAWYTAGITLSEEEAPTADITSAIDNFSKAFDDWTNDHYESESSTVELDGDGSARLLLPKRFTALTTVKTRDSAGTLTLQSSSVYRLISSLESTGSRRRSKDALDFLEVIPYGTGLSATVEGPYVWPCGPQTVQVIGTSGWTTTPERVKRAVALLVYNHFRPRGDSVMRATRWQTEGGAYERELDSVSGLPEVDDIIADLRRDIDMSLV